MNNIRNSILSTNNSGGARHTGNSKSKKIVLIMIIVLTTILVLGGGIFAYTYFFTDVFLSEEQGFYKYLSQNLEIIEMFQDEDFDKYLEKSQSEPYNGNGEFSIAFNGDIDEESKQIIDEIQNHKITFNTNVDNANKYSYNELGLKYGETDVISGTLVQQNDYLGLKVNDIGLKPFIVLENNNLKQFAKNLGLSDEEIASIPDKIDFEKIANEPLFTEEELKGIKERYLKAITDNLTEDMFSKSKQDGIDVYTLTITEEKGKGIVVALIDTLKNDEVVLNKLKQLYIEQQNVTEEEARALIDSMKTSLEEAKNELNGTSSNMYGDSSLAESNTIQMESTDKNENLYIRVYVSKKKLVKTEVDISNEGKVVLNNNENNVLLEIIETENSSDTQIATDTISSKVLVSIRLEKNKTDSELSYKFTITEEDNKELAKVTLSYTGLTEMTNVESKLLIDIYYTDSSDDILSQSQAAQNATINAQEKEQVTLAITQLLVDIYADTYTSDNEVVMNETTIKEALEQEGLNMTVSRNEDGTYRIQSNNTGNIYTMNSSGKITNTEIAESAENNTSIENEEKTINISLSFNGTTTFGPVEQQDLSNKYLVNDKSLQQLESLFTQLGQRVENKIRTAYQNTVIGQMITQ